MVRLTSKPRIVARIRPLLGMLASLTVCTASHMAWVASAAQPPPAFATSGPEGTRPSSIASRFAERTATAGKHAVVAEYEGIIHPIAVELAHSLMDRADTSNAALAVLVLRTPGGLLDSTRAIVSRMIAARTPVVVLVGPSGARAASAGFLILLAADVAAMAPGTHVGAAHPVGATGDAPADATMAKKIAEDVAAYARTLADARGRNASLAAEAVIESRAFTDREAFAASPRLIDLTAHDIADLVRQLDGRQIHRFDGRPVTLETTEISIEYVTLTWRQRLLSAIAHPQIAYMLLTLGMLGLVVELWTPGAIVPGVVGGLCVLLAFFAFQVLPINATGLLLIAFGVVLLILELKVPSFGVLGIGGTMALLAGSLMVTRDVPGMPDVRASYSVVVPVSLAFAAITLFLGRLAVQAHRTPSISGVDGLIGERGSTLTAMGPNVDGQVRVHGEIWRGSSAVEIAPGRRIRVTGVDGLSVRVEPSDADIPEGADT
jgi:membrane-bound serine protease (ClpP class)